MSQTVRDLFCASWGRKSWTLPGPERLVSFVFQSDDLPSYCFLSRADPPSSSHCVRLPSSTSGAPGACLPKRELSANVPSGGVGPVPARGVDTIWLYLYITQS